LTCDIKTLELGAGALDIGHKGARDGHRALDMGGADAVDSGHSRGAPEMDAGEVLPGHGTEGR